MCLADIYHNIGEVYDQQGNMGSALDFYAKSLRMREREDSPESKYAMCLTMENVAMIWRDQMKQGEALKMLSKVCLSFALLPMTKAIINR